MGTTPINNNSISIKAPEKRKKALIAIGTCILATIAIGCAGFAIWSSSGISRAERIAAKGGPGDQRLAGGRPPSQNQWRPGNSGGRGQGGQGGSGFAQRREAMMAQMNKELGLSPDQQKQVKTLGESMRPQMKALWQNDSLSRDQKFTQMKSIRDQMQSQMRAMLTPDQQKKFDAMQAQRQARRQQMQERREQTRASLIASGQKPPERWNGRGGNGPSAGNGNR